MKYFVTNAQCGSESDCITFCKMDGNKENSKSVQTYNHFLEELNTTVIFHKINRLAFAAENLLQIEYYEDDELKRAEFFFADSSNCEEY